MKTIKISHFLLSPHLRLYKYLTSSFNLFGTLTWHHWLIITIRFIHSFHNKFQFVLSLATCHCYLNTKKKIFQPVYTHTAYNIAYKYLCQMQPWWSWLSSPSPSRSMASDPNAAAAAVLQPPTCANSTKQEQHQERGFQKVCYIIAKVSYSAKSCYLYYITVTACT